MGFSSLIAAEAADDERSAVEEFKRERLRKMMVIKNRERKEREAAEAEAKAKAEAEKKAKKEAQTKKNLETRVRSRILYSPSATEADVTRLFDKVRDEIILEDARKAENENQAARGTGGAR